MTHQTRTVPYLDAESLPLVAFDEVFHVGTLNAADRREWSYEGEGLSVSVHPDDWANIARLPGPTWLLARTDDRPVTFVTFHDLTATHRDALREWGRDNGWITQQTAWKVSWYDDEANDTLTLHCNTHAEALDEAEARDEDPHTIAEVRVWRATDTFPQARISRDCDPTDVLLCYYVATHLPQADGVWWDDDYAPEVLSCPRGVLVGDLSRYRAQTRPW